MRDKGYVTTKNRIQRHSPAFSIEEKGDIERDEVLSLIKARKAMENSAPFSHHRTTLFLCGDVMTGRGIDQIMAYPSDPILHEPYVKNAYGYVQLAEHVNGPIDKPVPFSYIWGDGLTVLDTVKPDMRIINLETSVTTSMKFWPGKGIHYRMHPQNIGCLTSANIDCCILANNHVLDWGHDGLRETLDTLELASIQSVGAGLDRNRCRQPAVFDIPDKGTVLVFAYGAASSGVPGDWAAGADRPGINRIPDLSDQTQLRINEQIESVKKKGNIVLLSIHWGSNWGYRISVDERRFAHACIDNGCVDIVYGHSSHHAKGIEVYKGKLILYGCGDFLNDYEGISGYEEFRGDLSLMYFPDIDPLTGRLIRLQMMPMQIKGLQTIFAAPDDREWFMQMLNREGEQFGTKVVLTRDGFITLHWDDEAVKESRRS